MSKTLLADEIILGAVANDVRLMQGTVDPSAGGGVPATTGSKFLRGPGTAGDYTKVGAPDTAWQLTPADIYFNVANYGATGDGVTDDRAAIQLAITEAGLFGGCVFYPPGNYVCGFNGGAQFSFDLAGLSNVRFLGSGFGVSTLIHTGNAAGTARSLLQISASSSLEIEGLTLSQAGLSNPLANQCHLVVLGAGADITKLIHCRFIGGVANAGAYVRVEGSVGSLVSTTWISACQMVDAGGPAIWIDGYTETLWIEDSDITQSGSPTDTILIDEQNGGGIVDVKIFANDVTNANGYALRATAASGQLIERLQVNSANLFYGFVSLGWADRLQFIGNEIFAVAAGVPDAVLTIEGQNDHVQIQLNGAIGRASTCDDGLIFEVVAGAGAGEVTTRIQVIGNCWVQETEAGLVHVTDASNLQMLGNRTHTDNPGAAIHSAYVIEAGAAAIGNIQIADAIGAEAGEWEFGIEFVAALAIGLNQITGGMIRDVETGVRYDSSGGGSFTSSQTMLASNVIDASVAAWTSSATLYPRVGGNAGVFGVNVIQGTGDPEGNVTARIGSLYQRLDGGAATTLYVKESGTGAAGWVPK